MKSGVSHFFSMMSDHNTQEALVQLKQLKKQGKEYDRQLAKLKAKEKEPEDPKRNMTKRSQASRSQKTPMSRTPTRKIS